MLFFDHTDGFSFVYETVDEVQFYELIMICGGRETDRIECLNVLDCKSVSAFPSKLSRKNCGKGVLCSDEILTFGYSISGTNLKPPFKTTEVLPYNKGQRRSHYGVANVSKNAVVLVGGCSEYPTKEGSYFFWVPVKENNVMLHNPIKKATKSLAPLPYKLSDMAVVAHEDSVIIVGGRKGDYEKLTNDVLMYNITNQHCLKLPSMLEKRSRCAAVIMENKVIAIGGEDGRSHALKTGSRRRLLEETSRHALRKGWSNCVCYSRLKNYVKRRVCTVQRGLYAVDMHCGQVNIHNFTL